MSFGILDSNLFVSLHHFLLVVEVKTVTRRTLKKKSTESRPRQRLLVLYRKTMVGRIQNHNKMEISWEKRLLKDIGRIS